MLIKTKATIGTTAVQNSNDREMINWVLNSDSGADVKYVFCSLVLAGDFNSWELCWKWLNDNPEWFAGMTDVVKSNKRHALNDHDRKIFCRFTILLVNFYGYLTFNFFQNNTSKLSFSSLHNNWREIEIDGMPFYITEYHSLTDYTWLLC